MLSRSVSALVRPSLVLSSCFRSKSKGLQALLTTRLSAEHFLRHEGFQRVFGMEADEALTKLYPMVYSQENIFEGISDKVKKLHTLEHTNNFELIEELAIQKVCQDVGWEYTNENANLEIEVIRSTIELWRHQTHYRMTKQYEKQGHYLQMRYCLERRNRSLEELRNIRFENYAKIMEALDITLDFQPELLIPESKWANEVKMMKVHGIVHKMKTDAAAKKREDLFESTKEKYRQRILAEESALVNNA